MPPPDSGQTLTSEQIELLQKWIASGAEWSHHWAFVTPERAARPKTQQTEWCQNEIDHFVLANLERHGLQPSPKADRRTLIRRVTLDLTGLPPTPMEVAEYLADRSPDAWSRVVDRLLSSPRYGEHMATFWLDAARYADTSGYQTDGPREMWRWRDWVIDAYNSNMPFDRFTVEQLAGDLLPDASLSQKIATGFNRNHRGNAEGGVIPEEYQVEYVVDRVDTTSTVWLGLTIGCARCHDHKYDPISQREFYQMFAYFNNVPEHGRARKEGNSPPYILAPTKEQEQILKRLDRRITQQRNLLLQMKDEIKASQSLWEMNHEQRQRPVWTAEDVVHHFPLDGNLSDSVTTGSTPAAEQPESSRANVGFAVGRHGRAAKFNGVGPVDLGDIADFGYFDRFSVSAWVMPREASGTILSRMVHEERGSGYYLHLQDGLVQVNLIKRWLDDSIRIESRQTLDLDNWQHLTVTYDGSRVADGIKVYLNGLPLEMRVLHDGINQSFATDEPLRIGGGHGNFSGRIDDVQIYNYVLTANDALVSAVPQSVGDILNTAEKNRSRAQALKLSRTFVQFHAPDHIRKAHQNLRESIHRRIDLIDSIPTVMVMEEMAVPRKTYVLTRGQYDAPGESVTAGVPQILPSLPTSAPPNRLGFARWLVSPGHPLTARVTVNRFWQSYFGTGLVRTTEDFGAQGEAPSHPKLLDWLAAEFSQNGWNVKALHKLIVSSATYQQSSSRSADLEERDPDNRMLARGPRFRLPAETVRDQALFVSGLLTEKVGGPSVRPYQPAGLWKDIASTTDYQQSHAADLYRRSVYTYWKRTVAPPTMIALDATARESCTVKRSRTNTPLQALALMNEVTFVEAARVLAHRVLQSPPTTNKERIEAAFEIVISRPPTSAELAVFEAALKRNVAVYRDDLKSAQALLAVGEAASDETLDTAELAAWMVIMSVILNLDEVVTKE